MVAVELSLTALVAAGYSNAHFVLRSDNKGVCGALEGGKSCNEEQNMVLRHTVKLFREHSLWFTTQWISTKDNLADNPSRGLLPPVEDIFPHIPTIPFHLRSLIEKPVRKETYKLYKRM